MDVPQCSLNAFIAHQERLSRARDEKRAGAKRTNSRTDAKWREAVNGVLVAISEMNACLASDNLLERFSYVADPFPSNDLATGIIRVQSPNASTKFDVNLYLFVNCDIGLLCSALTRSPNYFSLAEATLWTWRKLLADIYKVFCSSEMR